MEPLVRRTVRLALLSFVVPFVLAACSTSYNCQRVQAYMYAQQFPALKSPPGLNVPPPDPSMTIPEVDGGPVARYDDPPRNAANNEFAHCLVSPPLMPE